MASPSAHRCTGQSSFLEDDMTFDELILDNNIKSVQIKYADESGWSTIQKEYVTPDMLKEYVYITMDPLIPHCAIFGKESVKKDYFL